MILLLGTDGVVGFRSIVSIRESASRLTDSQFRSVVLIDEVQRVQSALGSVLYRLASGGNRVDREQLGKRVDNIEESFRGLFASIPEDDPDIALWRSVEADSEEATREADRILSTPSQRADLVRLMAAREKLLASTSALIHANHARAEATRRQIEDLASRQLAEDATLLTCCLLTAVLCAWLVLSTASKLNRQVSEHAAELGRVSWQLLERQENLARRLSHELHDELGQSLTALKTNFARFAAAHEADPKWMEDCSGLLRDSIRSAHEISQLLRPTILDDFGLDSALQWLCDRFEERNRIEVRYTGSPGERLDAQSETHVFRIAQEALTNIAKHAGASRVDVSLRRDGNHIRFLVRDNGKGMSPDPAPTRPQFGITGMKARARSLDGVMRVHSTPGKGTELELVFPRKAIRDEEEAPHPAG